MVVKICRFYNYICIIIIFLDVFFGSLLFAATIGFDNKVTNFTSQQTINNGDRVASFGFLRAGFQISGSSVSATFDAVFPVSGDVDFNSGTLSLDADLVFCDVATIKSLGSITGNNHKMELCTSIESFPETPGPGEFTDLHVVLNGGVAINSSIITFKGNSSINGQGNCLDLNQTSTIVIDSNAHLYLNNISIEGILGSNIYCTDNTSTLSVENVKWILDSDYNFNAGKLEVSEDFHVIGNGYNFTYQTSQECVVNSNSRLILDNNVTFSYDPPSANRDLLKLFDDTSDLVLRGATLFSTTTGIRLTKGNVIVERKSFVSCDGSVEGEAVSFGDGASAANNVSVQCVGAANLEIINGFVVDNTV